MRALATNDVFAKTIDNRSAGFSRDSNAPHVISIAYCAFRTRRYHSDSNLTCFGV
jgi:hypothetical protein